MTALTEVELVHLEGKVERWVRFGREAQERIVDRRRRVLAFAPNSVFAFVRWASNDYGTVVSRVDVLRAVSAGEPLSTVPFVSPGAEILLRLSGWPKVAQLLAAADQVEAVGIAPEDACPDHWQHVHNRITAGEPPRAYLPRGVPLLKHIAALGGQRVCRIGLTISVDGVPFGDALERDRRGRPLPVWQGCVVLTKDQVFLMNPDRPDSLDGRYFGPLDRSTIVGRAQPLWTDEED